MAQRILVIEDKLYTRKGIQGLLNIFFSKVTCLGLTVRRSRKFLMENPGEYLIIFDPTYQGPEKSPLKIADLKVLSPRSQILIHSEVSPIQLNLLACLEAGANGYLSKRAQKTEYFAAISMIMHGRPYLTKDVKEGLVQILRKRGSLKKLLKSKGAS